jgi:hypothetical protein
MSIPIPNVDLSSAVVGTTGIIDLSRVGVGAGGVSSNPVTIARPSHLWMFNDSGCTLTCTFGQTGNGFKLPAGGWTTIDLPPGEFQIKWVVDFVLTNAPISLLMSTYYGPNENLPASYTLGNSPIGGAVQATGGGVVTADHLINTGNAASGSSIISIRETGATGDQINADNQGNFLVQDYVASILTTILRVIAGGGAGSVDVLIGDTTRQIQLNGQTHARSRIWADSEITISDSVVGSGGGSSTVTNVQMFNNNDRGIEVLPNSGITGFTGVQVDSSGVNTTGTGFTAAAVQLGAWLTSCYTGMKIDGLAPGGGIDMTGMAAGSGPSIATGPNPVALKDGAGTFATANGSVAGALQLRCPIWGAALKIAIVTFFALNTASAISVSFPSAFTNSGVIWSGDIGGSTTFGLTASSVIQTCRQVVYGAAGVAGTTSAQTVLRTANQYAFLSFADALQVQTTGGAGINNSIIIMGY